MDLNLTDAAYVARVIAHRVGGRLLQVWSLDLGVEQLDSGHLVTQQNDVLDNFIIDELRSLYPTHGFISREVRVPARSPYTWHVNSIDGTKYYARRIPLFAVTLGLTRDEFPVLGVVYNPVSHQLYWGYEGSGRVMCNYESLSPRREVSLFQAIGAVDFASLEERSPLEQDWAREKYLDLSGKLYRVRALGSSSLALTWIAAGGLDVYVDLTGGWDFVSVPAGLALLAAIGGSWREVDLGFDRTRLVAGLDQKLVDKVRDLLRAGVPARSLKRSGRS